MELKICQNKKGILSLEMIITQEEVDQFTSRLLLEGKSKKANLYIIPLKYLYPLSKKMGNKELKFNKDSVTEFLEFSDCYEEKYFYKEKADANYMKLWRENSCPEIYKYTIDIENEKVIKQICFEKIR